LPLPAFLVELLAMAGIVLVVGWVAQQPGKPNWQLVLFLAISAACGAVSRTSTNSACKPVCPSLGSRPTCVAAP
jgi:hypothetical protein